MLRLVISRTLSSLAVLALLICSVFFLMRFAPGGPFDSERVLPPEIQRQIEHRYGLDAPVALQFGRWINCLFRGDLGTSFQHPDREVWEILATAVPHSAALGGLALGIALLLGVPLGVLAGSTQNHHLDRAIRLLVLTSVSLPGFVVASALVAIFAIRLQWLPPALWEGPAHWVLPSVTLMIRPMALITRLVRGSVREALAKDFVRTALAKGLSFRQALWRHALRNAWIPCIGLLGPIAAHLLTGSFLVETIFQIPGLGRYFVSAVINRDYGLVMGTTLVFGVLLIAFNALTEALMGWADPRIRSQEGRS
jgi:oligopeptide transport system permease protein